MTITTSPIAAIRLFCSYAHENYNYLTSFEQALASLKRSGLIEFRSSQKILAGMDYKEVLKKELDIAQIIVLLVSNSYIGSDYCWNHEMPHAIARHKGNEARIIPVLVEPCLWDITPFGMLQPLPTDAKAVSLWKNKDEAWMSVAVGIQEVVKDIQLKSLGSIVPDSVREKPTKSDAIIIKKILQQLVAFSETQPNIQFSTGNLIEIGDARYVSGEVDEAVRLYRKSIAVNPEIAAGWQALALAFDEGYGRYEDALKFYNVALALDSTLVEAYVDRSYVLRKLGSFAASVDSATSALRFDVSNARAFYNLACSHARASHISEALVNLAEAVRLLPARYSKMAAIDPDFESLRASPEFLKLVSCASLT